MCFWVGSVKVLGGQRRTLTTTVQSKAAEARGIEHLFSFLHVFQENIGRNKSTQGTDVI